MPDDLYERDIVAWCDRQASLLRRLAAGERVNADVDWPNVVEEMEALGRSETRACENLLRQAIIHLLKQIAWPDSRARLHWREEVMSFLFEAESAFSPSMRQLLDVNTIYARARRDTLRLQDELGPAQALPDRCPLTLDDLLSEQADVDELLAKLSVNA